MLLLLMAKSIIEAVVSVGSSLILNWGKEKFSRIHLLSSGENEISLNRRLQRQGFYWTKIAKMLLKWKGMYVVPGSSQDRGIFLRSWGKRLETAYLDFLLHKCCYPIHLMWWKSRENPHLLLRKNYCLEEASIRHLWDVWQVTRVLK